MYSDETPIIKTQGWSRIVEQADTITVQGGMANFVNAMFLVDAVHNQGGDIPRLILPYIPGARQDRVNPTGDVLFTLSSVASMVNARHFDEVVVLDPHSDTSNRLIRDLVEYPLSDVAQHLPTGYSGIIAPDYGARERAAKFGTAMRLPVFYGGKNRDVSTGQLTEFTLEELGNQGSLESPGHYLVVDDICDGGGTFLGLMEKIKEQGAMASLYVSHGIFSKGTSNLLGSFEEIITTDSLHIDDRLGVTVLPVVKHMQEYTI